MSWWIPDYQPSDHESEIIDLYRDVDSGERPAFPVERSLFLCFTNRAGSNFLGSALASTGGVKPAREYLNHPMVRRRSERLGINSFDEYLRQLADEFGHMGTFTLKIGLRQLYFLAKLGFIGGLLPDPRFVLIERDDVVAQAVSWVKAIQTGQWMSSQEMGEGDLVYDFDAIHQRLDGVLTENAAFRAFLARNDCATHFVRYEELREHPGPTIKMLAEALDLGDARYRSGRVTIEPQHSKINAQWKARYLKEVRTL